MLSAKIQYLVEGIANSAPATSFQQRSDLRSQPWINATYRFVMVETFLSGMIIGQRL